MNTSKIKRLASSGKDKMTEKTTKEQPETSKEPKSKRVQECPQPNVKRTNRNAQVEKTQKGYGKTINRSNTADNE